MQEKKRHMQKQKKAQVTHSRMKARKGDTCKRKNEQNNTCERKSNTCKGKGKQKK